MNGTATGRKKRRRRREGETVEISLKILIEFHGNSKVFNCQYQLNSDTERSPMVFTRAASGEWVDCYRLVAIHWDVLVVVTCSKLRDSSAWQVNCNWEG